MVVARDSLPVAELPRELVECEGIGEVIVQGMGFGEGIRFSSAQKRLREPLPGETADETEDRVRGELVPMLLSMCVLAADEQPLYTRRQWAAWSFKNLGASIELFGVAMRLSGTDASAEKKS